MGSTAAPILSQKIQGIPGAKSAGDPLPAGRKNPHEHNNLQFGADQRNY